MPKSIALPTLDIRGQTTVFLKTLSFSRGAGFFSISALVQGLYGRFDKRLREVVEVVVVA